MFLFGGGILPHSIGFGLDDYGVRPKDEFDNPAVSPECFQIVAVYSLAFIFGRLSTNWSQGPSNPEVRPGFQGGTRSTRVLICVRFSRSNISPIFCVSSLLVQNMRVYLKSETCMHTRHRRTDPSRVPRHQLNAPKKGWYNPWMRQ
jgi:hypothetical protein